MIAASRRVTGDYWLWRTENDRYYLERGYLGDSSGAGVARGSIDEIGWDDKVVVVRRTSAAGPGASEWLVFDVKTHAVSGPYSAEEWGPHKAKEPLVRQIQTSPVPQAWTELGKRSSRFPRFTAGR
jgi:hypothetical protein